MGSSRPRSESSSKAERKFEKKLQFYAKVRDSVVKKAICKKKRRKKLSKAFDLSALSKNLPNLEEKPLNSRRKRRLNCKSRQELVIQEGDKLNAVLSDPAFQANPFAVIFEHLQKTLPKEEPSKKLGKKKGEKGQKKSSNRRPKGAPDTHSMDII